MLADEITNDPPSQRADSAWAAAPTQAISSGPSRSYPMPSGSRTTIGTICG